MKPLLSSDALSVFYDGIFASPRLAHPEGVAVHPDGSVWAGTETGNLIRIAADGKSAEGIVTSDGFLLGIAFDAAGNCYACDMKHAAIYKYDVQAGTFTNFASAGITVPNYPVIDDKNNYLYVSDSYNFDEQGGGVFRYDLSTGEGGLWTQTPMNFANGMAMAADGKGLYVVESSKAQVSFVPIKEDGTAGVHEVVVEGLDVIPDGVLVMDNGDLLISNYEPSRIYRHSKSKGLELLVEDKLATILAHPTNIALKDGNLVTSNLGRWHISHVDLSDLI
ncbi:MAG: SMP-30/gluconolactonase/LRE family protein [Hyphomicrobiales bacterium]|nr:SMP-30/gluconolactonase/LRE family protein [Hyphomicrobiales bacterium]